MRGLRVLLACVACQSVVLGNHDRVNLPHPPLVPSGFAPWDELVSFPWQRATRYAKAALRGFWHASRDVLFPEYREVSTATRPIGSLDDQLVDEGTVDYQRRLAWRIAFLEAADIAGLPAFYKSHPEVVRTGFAVIVGVGFLAIMALLQVVARAATALFVKIAYREVDDGDDDEEEQAPVVDEASVQETSIADNEVRDAPGVVRRDSNSAKLRWRPVRQSDGKSSVG